MRLSEDVVVEVKLPFTKALPLLTCCFYITEEDSLHPWSMGGGKGRERRRVGYRVWAA
jgi:hypothetical protein